MINESFFHGLIQWLIPYYFSLAVYLLIYYQVWKRKNKKEVVFADFIDRALIFTLFPYAYWIVLGIVLIILTFIIFPLAILDWINRRLKYYNLSDPNNFDFIYNYSEEKLNRYLQVMMNIIDMKWIYVMLK